MPNHRVLSDTAAAGPRPIVRHPQILGGRWRLDGTTMAVAEIKADYATRPAGRDDSYRYLDLTPAELEAVLAFAFPAVRETRVDLGFGFVTVACECGEDTSAGLLDARAESVACICGREWIIRVYVEPKPAQRR